MLSKLINQLKNKNKVFKLFRIILSIASFVFVFFLIYKNKSDLSNLDITLLPKACVISIIPSFIAMFFQIKELHLILQSENINLPYKDVLFIVAKSNVARYIPGGVWNHVSIGFDLKDKVKKQLSAKKIAKVLILNTVIILISGLIFLIFFIPKYYVLFYLVFYIVILVSIIKIFKKFFLDSNTVVLSLAYICSVIFWVFSALSFFLFCVLLTRSIGLDLSDSVKIGASFVVSWVIGFLAIPIPSGLGVREFVMEILLKQVQSFIDIGATFSLSYRFLILFRDLMILIFAYILVSWSKLKMLALEKIIKK